MAERQKNSKKRKLGATKMSAHGQKDSLLAINILRIRIKYSPPPLELAFWNCNSCAHCLDGILRDRRSSFRNAVGRMPEEAMGWVAFVCW
jgi:hypothetical protein